MFTLISLLIAGLKVIIRTNHVDSLNLLINLIFLNKKL